MRVFDIIQTKVKDINDLAEWLDKFKVCDDTPWLQWYDKKYCKNCEPIVKDGLDYGHCELNDNCRYFKDMDDIPDNEEMIKMWLESEAIEERECPECRYFAGCEAACGGKICDMFIPT
jgi:hypothetical protein